MTDEPEKLTDADPEDFKFMLAHTLRFDGRKRVHTSDELMARVTADRIFEQLRLAGYVIKKKPPARQHSSSDYQPRLKD